MNISVFGGAQPRPESPEYEEARLLGGLLAQRGHTVLTGGYIGVMEAASRGAHEAGGHVIGVTCEDIEAWRKVSKNQWVKEEWRKKTLLERMQAIIEGSDAAIAMPGGVGTLAEISVMWNLMAVESLPRRPLILVGGGWQSTLDQFFNSFEHYMPMRQRESLLFAENAQKAVKKLEGYRVGTF
jgi:hypothetical protein